MEAVLETISCVARVGFEGQALEPRICLGSNPARVTLDESLPSMPQLSLCKMGPMVGCTSQG